MLVRRPHREPTITSTQQARISVRCHRGPARTGGRATRWLKILLAANGAIFVAYALSNTLLPTSYFAPADAPGYAVDVIRVVGIAYAALGLIQLGMWWVSDRTAIQVVAWVSLAFAAGFGVLALIQGTGSSDAYTQVGLLAGVGNLVVAGLYGFRIYRERAAATA